MPTADLPIAGNPRPPYVRLEVCQEMPDGEIRVHLGLDLRVPLTLADTEALALRMAGELARTAHAQGPATAGGGTTWAPPVREPAGNTGGKS